ncbi:response regulator transcription factor [Xanthobacter sp. DSM 24535]|uniref:response regulator transcription factor n=1 Tax=Roseixanthobacter psychrophilus TaxID=3119917 RepID=UPI0037262C4B
MAIHVLIIEDDGDLRDSLETYLTGAGFKVRGIRDARHLEREMASRPADVIILDVNLPGLSGFETAEKLRERMNVGIIILTGRAQREDRLQGLSVGADHYVTKPADPEELELLIRNLHRRLSGRSDLPAPERPAPGQWVFLTARWSLISPAGAVVSLSAAEHHLLDQLTARAGESVPRAQLLVDAKRYSPDALGRSLDLVVFRLRRKVEVEAGDALPIASARGIGYVFTQAVVRED